ncbi:uncharacterized protein BO95DRAFT_70625 [Aspergillus brunneoviolaceus CBS 621.78]|uniref:Uncharacterized protein n=1 Tax=Aspergillus brunneoviolaceus CBS 621.78 TaxID=1450534 RepID=A0ACD1GF82_9EURO|nr:hypothetical protein BO95DRAFT_70625 [Aspergillus brunneoviolaceus CBS 621.78]RAH47838.1 hypothetical protein BO95DRAFT_70625 [Aspergillus brunneoviolaceus CBS 621.78]
MARYRRISLPFETVLNGIWDPYAWGSPLVACAQPTDPHSDPHTPISAGCPPRKLEGPAIYCVRPPPPPSSVLQVLGAKEGWGLIKVRNSWTGCDDSCQLQYSVYSRFMGSLGGGRWRSAGIRGVGGLHQSGNSAVGVAYLTFATWGSSLRNEMTVAVVSTGSTGSRLCVN